MKTTYNLKYLLTFLSFTVAAFSSFAYSQNSKSNRTANLERHNKQVCFLEFFPDKGLASFVAEKLNKKITDNVTVKEIASIKGDFNIGVQPVSNLKGIGYLIGIDTFHCYKNDVTEIPAEIGKLSNLKYLDLCKAFELKKIPREIGQLKQLKKIRLNLTEVKSIPKEIGSLTNLETLWICCNEFTEIPESIGRLKNLKELDIHSNKFKSVPNEICNLTSLTSLDISHSEIEQLPENIGNLKKLQFLNLFNDNLKYLPKSIIQLDNLTQLNVFDNFELSENYKKYLPKLLRKQKKK